MSNIAVVFHSGYGHTQRVAQAVAEGATVVLSATVPPAYARDLGRRLGERGLHLLDAPVSGGAAGADAGTLTIMASGPPAAFEAADGPLADYGTKGVDDERLSGGLAGVIGTVVVLVLAGGLALVVRRRSPKSDEA